MIERGRKKEEMKKQNKKWMSSMVVYWPRTIDRELTRESARQYLTSNDHPKKG